MQAAKKGVWRVREARFLPPILPEKKERIGGQPRKLLLWRRVSAGPAPLEREAVRGLSPKLLCRPSSGKGER